MAQFIAFDPNTEVNGATIMSITAGLGASAEHVLAAHGLDNLQADQWYPQQLWLDAFRDIASGTINAMLDLVSIGMKINERAHFPPDINSIESALQSIDVAYHMNHHGGEIGSYQYIRVSGTQIDLVCRNPYPCDFDYGLIYGTVQRFRLPRTPFVVEHDGTAPCRKRGADSCTYHVTWQKG